MELISLPIRRRGVPDSRRRLPGWCLAACRFHSPSGNRKAQGQYISEKAHRLCCHFRKWHGWKFGAAAKRCRQALRCGCCAKLPSMPFSLLSEEPMISQLWMTSQTAMPWDRRRCFFSSTAVGAGSFVICERTFQKRFWGCP